MLGSALRQAAPHALAQARPGCKLPPQLRCSASRACVRAAGQQQPGQQQAGQQQAGQQQAGQQGQLTTDWEARRKRRVCDDLLEATRRKGPACTQEQISAGVDALEQLLPGLQIDVEALPARDWARLVLDSNAAAVKIIALKRLYPKADLTRIVQRQPSVLLLDVPTLEDNAAQVKQLLETAKEPDALLTALPSLLDPRTCISVIVTVRKWYFGKRDPVEVLEADPELVLRAQDCDMPWEPTYLEADGSIMAPGLAYHERRTDWQRHIDQTFYKQE